MSSYLRGRRRRHTWALILGLGFLAGTAPTGRSQEVVATQQSQIARCYVKTLFFELPLNITEKTRAATKEIRLYCKANPTSAWTLLEKCPPDQAKFTFHARKDGEYLFTITMVDPSGREVPGDPDKSLFRLAVIIDSQPPQAELQFLDTSSEGHNVQIDIRDTNLDPAETQVFFQTKDQKWQALESAQKSNRYTIPIQAAITGMVRVRAADLAGNISQRDFDVSAQVNGAASAKTPPANSIPVTNVNGSPIEVVSGSGLSPQINPITAQDASNPPPVSPVEPVAARSFPTATGSTPDFSDRNPLPPPPGFDPGDPNKNPAGPPSQPEKSSATPWPAAPQLAANSSSITPPGQILGSSTSNHRNSNTVSHHVINHKQLSLDYKIEQVGPSGVGKVEVWLTTDQSKTWQRLGEDAEAKSPVAIQLPGEGLYGVSLVVSNGRGYGGTPPKAGDAPDAWIEVDVTKPVVDFTNIRAGTGDDAGAIFVSWLAQDRNLSAEAVELYYAASRDSKWLPVAKGLKSEGRYRWLPPTDVGSQVFFRIVARDLAGNTAVVETKQAVAVDDQSRPRGRLLGISPLAPEVRLEPMGN